MPVEEAPTAGLGRMVVDAGFGKGGRQKLPTSLLFKYKHDGRK